MPEMIGVLLEQLEILKAVIVTDSVPMMHYFFRGQIPPQVRLHHEAMLADVAFPARIRMTWTIATNVAITINIPPAFP